MSPRAAGLCPGDILAGWQRCQGLWGDAGAHSPA